MQDKLKDFIWMLIDHKEKS